MLRESPSTRRAWIEIAGFQKRYSRTYVALHPEGVDRNSTLPKTGPKISVALHPEGVDRNIFGL